MTRQKLTISLSDQDYQSLTTIVDHIQQDSVQRVTKSSAIALMVESYVNALNTDQQQLIKYLLSLSNEVQTT